MILHINVAVVTVIHTHQGVPLVLREYRNGHEREFPGSLGEKIKTELGETPLDAVRRGLKEELGATEPKFRDVSLYTIKHELDMISESDNSDFYPGLLDVYHRYTHLCTIDKALFHNIYKAHDNGRHICFKWIPR